MRGGERGAGAGTAMERDTERGAGRDEEMESR